MSQWWRSWVLLELQDAFLRVFLMASEVDGRGVRYSHDAAFEEAAQKS